VARSPAGRGHMRVVARSRQRIGAVTWRRPDFLQAADAPAVQGRMKICPLLRRLTTG